MRLRIATLLATAVLLAHPAASAEDYTKGTVEKIDAKAGKVTIAHEDIKSLDMPAMTMVFRVADPAMIERMRVGRTVEFVVERKEGKLTITALK